MITVSEDLAIKLRDAGYLQSFNHHYGYYTTKYWNKNGVTEVKYSYGKEHVNLVNSHWNFICVAPTANELFDQLPWGVNLRKNKNNYCANYAHIPQSRKHADNTADALARVWLLLKEQSLIFQKEKI